MFPYRGSVSKVISQEEMLVSALLNNVPIQPNQYPNFVYPENDEIDLKELFIVLLQGKWIILISTLIFSALALVYALTSQEWWSAKATVSQPQLQDIASYQQAVKRNQPLFDAYQLDGTIIVSEALDKLIAPELIFEQFIQDFNSNSTKRRFMQTNSTFLSLQKKLLPQHDSESLQEFYQLWFPRISAVGKKVNKEVAPSHFTLSFQSIDRASSLTLLSQYVQFVNQILNQQLNQNLSNTLATKYSEIKQQETSLRSQAKLSLQIELERTKHALRIAEEAGIKQPLQNLGQQDIFAINIGSRALKSRMEVLKAIEDLSVFEPRLAILQSQLSQFDLDTLSGNADWTVNGFYYLDEPEQPLTRDKPKRALICVLGTLLGGMLGVAIVLVRFAFRKEDTEDLGPRT